MERRGSCRLIGIFAFGKEGRKRCWITESGKQFRRVTHDRRFTVMQ
jgi:hypothetical protein